MDGKATRDTQRDVLGRVRSRSLLLLDMNSTFMFGEDRFSESEDYSLHYRTLGGELSAARVNAWITDAFDWLMARYPDPAHRECFPSVESALRAVSAQPADEADIARLVTTFAHHERGHVPEDHARALKRLARDFQLATVIDIWAPKNLWVDHLTAVGVLPLMATNWFSSDHGIVKPSPRPFEHVLVELKVPASDAVMIGDSVERDLAGARAAGVECILVGGARHDSALASFDSLLDLVRALYPEG